MRKLMIAAIASTAFVALPVAAQDTTATPPAPDAAATTPDTSATAPSATADTPAARAPKSKKHKKGSAASDAGAGAASSDAAGSASAPASTQGVSNWSPSDISGAGSTAAQPSATAQPAT